MYRFHRLIDCGPEWLLEVPLKKADFVLGYFDPKDYWYTCKIVVAVACIFFKADQWERVDYRSIDEIIFPGSKQDPLILRVVTFDGVEYTMVTQEAFGLGTWLKYAKGQSENYLGLRLERAMADALRETARAAGVTPEEFTLAVLSSHLLKRDG